MDLTLLVCRNKNLSFSDNLVHDPARPRHGPFELETSFEQKTKIPKFRVRFQGELLFALFVLDISCALVQEAGPEADGEASLASRQGGAAAARPYLELFVEAAPRTPCAASEGRARAWLAGGGPR